MNILASHVVVSTFNLLAAHEPVLLTTLGISLVGCSKLLARLVLVGADGRRPERAQGYLADNRGTPPDFHPSRVPAA